MDERQIDLSKYRLQEAEDTLKVADRCFQESDYDDFYIASKAQAEEQYNTAKYTLEQVSQYLSKNNTDESKE